MITFYFSDALRSLLGDCERTQSQLIEIFYNKHTKNKHLKTTKMVQYLSIKGLLWVYINKV